MIVGTAGHIDHGKTALVKALTGVDADRLREEKERGITIDLGFAYWPQQDAPTIGFVDVPGHERFVHTMLAGAQGVDRVILVIAADDGIMPQTREHLDILHLLGLERGCIALTKIDAVTAERLADARNEIAMALAGTPLGDAPIFPLSSLTGEGVEALADWLRTENRMVGERRDDRLFRLAVDRSFVLHGAGVVVTGMVLDGSVAVGDEVMVSPGGLSARVRSIHAQNRPAERGVAGERCALNLAGAGISKEAVRRGDMLVAPAGHAPTQRIDADLLIAEGWTKPVRQWMPVRLHHGAAELGAHIVLLGDNPQPGAHVPVQLVLERPIAARQRDRFVLRDPSASWTIGGGRFLDLRPPERKRRSAERYAILEALQAEDAGDALQGLLSHALAPVDLVVLARDRGVALESLRASASDAGATLLEDGRQVFAIGEPQMHAVRAAVERELAAFHGSNPDLAGMGLERLRLLVAGRIAAPLFRGLLRRWAGEGLLVIDGHWIRLASHSVALSVQEENLWDEIHPMLGGSERFRPPRVRDIGQRIGEDEDVVRRVLHRCGRMGRVDEVAHDHFFLRAVTAELVNLAHGVELEQQGWFNAAAYRDMIEAAGGAGVGRKVAIQILEFFDRHGVTLRRGDNRRINPHRRYLFDRDAPDEGVLGREASPVGRPDFKSGGGREPVFGGFDSHSLPPPPADHPPGGSA